MGRGEGKGGRCRGGVELTCWRVIWQDKVREGKVWEEVWKG